MIRRRCPVCNEDGGCTLVWKIPFEHIDPIVVGPGTVCDFPMCQTTRITQWMECGECQSVYLDVVAENQAHGSINDARHYIEKMKATKNWVGYADRWRWFSEFIPSESKVLVDAAGAIGQYLTVASDSILSGSSHPWGRLIGIDLCAPYVAEMNRLGFDGHCIDLAEDIDLAAVVGCDNADFLVFSEAFEHMRYVGDTMVRLMSLLRTGGRMFFSAQALGAGLPVRPAETIYLNEHGLMVMADQIGMKILKTEIRSGRFFVVGEKI